jgi:hypothetical protein
MIDAYPLQWPIGWRRTAIAERVRAKFGKKSWSEDVGRAIVRDLSIDDGTKRVLSELSRMGVERGTIVISTNLRLRLDGLPISKQNQPSDVGAAVYWIDPATNASRCMAIDIYDRIADNLGAVAATIKALRLIERHGGAQVLARAFTGFTALPAPGQTSACGWREVLELSPDYTPQRDGIDRAYKVLRSRYHPDKTGGDGARFHEIQLAYDQACAELRNL